MVYAKRGSKRLNNADRSQKVLTHLNGFPRLEALLIHESQASDEGLEHVGQLTHLRDLYIWDAAAVTDDGVYHLRNLRKLEYLHLSDSQITDESLRVLARLPKLRGLSLQGSAFSDRGLEYVRDMTQLRTFVVGLGDNEITDDGLVHLRQLTRLERLGLQRSQVTETGLRHLVHLKNLKDLWLTNSRVEDTSWLQQRLPNCAIKPK